MGWSLWNIMKIAGSLDIQCTYEESLAPRNKVSIEELIVAQLSKKFPHIFYFLVYVI
jgi:hypothetical protein